MDVTFLERGLNRVSAVHPLEINAYGYKDVQVTGGPPPVDVEIVGPSELVADKAYEFEARPEQQGVEFAVLEWDVPSVADTQFEETGSGHTVDIEIKEEGEFKIELYYETEEGYSNTAYTFVDVFDLSRDRENKLELAAEIDDLAVALEEVDIADVLDDIIVHAKSGRASPSTAREAIYRMRLMEDVTETTLAGMGPGTAWSPETDLVGEPESSIVTQDTYEHPALPSAARINLTAETVESILWMAIGLISGIKFASKLVKKVNLENVLDAKEVLVDQLDSLVSLLPPTVDVLGALYDEVADLVGFIESEEEEDGETLVERLVDPVGEISEQAANTWQAGFETFGIANSDLKDHLDEVNDTMRGGPDGIDLEGTRAGAEAAAQTGKEKAEDRIEIGVNAFATFDILSTMGDLLSAGAGIAVALTSLISLPVAAALALLGILATLAAEFISTTNGMIQLWTLREIHQQSKNGIIAGEDWA